MMYYQYYQKYFPWYSWRPPRGFCCWDFGVFPYLTIVFNECTVILTNRKDAEKKTQVVIKWTYPLIGIYHNNF